MNYYPLFIVIILAVLDWFAAERKIKVLEYIAKPATMIVLIYWIWLNAGLGGDMLWFTLGVVFGLAGDIFLMIPKNMFIFGLLAFLAGHISYVIALNTAAPYINILGIILIVLLGVYIGWLYPELVEGLKTKGKIALKIPILIYSLVIGAMVYSAIMTWTRPGWETLPSLIVSLGAIFFLASDSILAWDRFKNSVPHARLLTMITYHLGQIGIIMGAMLSLTGK